MRLFGSERKKAKMSFDEREVKAKCQCGNECGISDIKKARIIVLGACCSKSTKTFDNVKKAVAEMAILEEVVNIGDVSEIAKFGVMSTPALVIDSKVASMGKLIKVNEAKLLIEKSGFLEK